MSLLNNALREAEQRQRRPGVSSAYTGAVQESRSGKGWLLVLLAVLLIGLLAAGIYYAFMMSPTTPDLTGDSVLASVENGQVDRPQPEPEVLPPPSIEPEPEPVQAQRTPEPKAPAPEFARTEPSEPVAATKPEIRPEPKPEPRPESASSPEPPPEPEPEPAAPVVKTAPQSPDAIDRTTAKELETLIASGRMVEAEGRLKNLAQTQPAPRSRFTVARALLVGGEVQRALDWLPEAAAAKDPTLRMLRARAQHADGRLDAAVATLASSVPPVADQPEYRVTLATLLQQQGQSREAAAHWAELIAWNDSRAPWWVGLAVALEEQGETRSAVRAYEQAVALPGLPPSLADYVQRRLQSLRAG
ncbi:tetratricopeptide repeat protein [Marinobacter confluentis]|uniref:Tetratricopeptide repeat protein n=1 Tax=Marinobacter confluentis TaxID=1697557 RepID=A0A4Z1BV97_9GAMM|nr:tetratricopeptide repeat protein [Marinobacter confluentis]TGN38547.1 tetratricopeptide repeat protein [Marinobacter confluentis]